MSLLSRNVKKTSIISIILVIILSFGSLFYINSISEADIKSSIFEKEKHVQVESTASISKHIGSDLNLVMSMLDGLANSFYIQRGDTQSDNSKRLIEQKYLQFDDIINRLFILDKNDLVTASLAPKGSETFLSSDFSGRDWVQETRSTLKPVFSEGFERQNVYRIFISYPILDKQTGSYLGMLVASIPTVNFFAHYGNVEHISSQFLVVFNKKGTMLANGASNTLIGENFFGESTQRFINYNKILNNLTQTLLSGKSAEAVYNYGKGERLTTEAPVFVQGEPRYFIQIVQPTTEIYSQINNVLMKEREKMFTLLGSTIAAIAVLAIFLIKWNSTLQSEVKKRTTELLEASEELREQEKRQREFINIAAHELRTPIQPILGLASVIRSKMKDPELLQLQDVIIRNAKRLQHLTEDLLDVARIESQNLRLRKEYFDINEQILNILTEIKSEVFRSDRIIIGANDSSSNNNNDNTLKFLFEPEGEIYVVADKVRIYQVISNLVRNAVKFTKRGTIVIKTAPNGNEVVVSVEDTGQGIDGEILAKLFSKFGTTSPSGTGLGLFISKAITEAHGGKIGAENNKSDGSAGATFYFTLPLASQPQKQVQQQQLQRQEQEQESHISKPDT
jgi:signal transduction histidine kinase